mmetsp:Transcript_5936/g.6533  ORF Transcript_5936/g.6533 Transcript_5936/m.6533 type:complete len:305 (-) Transcript_5936:606-1520(-)
MDDLCDDGDFQLFLESSFDFSEENSSIDVNSSVILRDPGRLIVVDLPQVHSPVYYQREKSKFKKKRRCINPKNMPEIRILRNDIRRKYGEMFLNIFNNHDSSLVAQFFDEFRAPQCKASMIAPTTEFIKAINSIALRRKKEEGVYGLHDFLSAFSIHCKMAPDTVLRIDECQIRARQGYQGSIIVIKARLSGTRISVAHTVNEDLSEDFILEASSTYVSTDDDDSSGSDSSSTINLLKSSQDLVHSLKIKEELILDKKLYKRVEIPMETSADVVFVLTVDAMHRIQHFRAEFFNFSEKPANWSL